MRRLLLTMAVMLMTVPAMADDADDQLAAEVQQQECQAECDLTSSLEDTLTMRYQELVLRLDIVKADAAFANYDTSATNPFWKQPHDAAQAAKLNIETAMFIVFTQPVGFMKGKWQAQREVMEETGSTYLADSNLADGNWNQAHSFYGTSITAARAYRQGIFQVGQPLEFDFEEFEEQVGYLEDQAVFFVPFEGPIDPTMP